MDTGDWEDLKEEVCTYLAIGYESGEPELETVTRLIWLERQKNAGLSAALAAIQSAASAAFEYERKATGKSNNVLDWHPAPRSVGPFLAIAAATKRLRKKRGEGASK